VNGVFRLLTVGVKPLSIALTGVLLQAFGGVTTILIVFVPQVILAALTTIIPRLRRAAPADTGGEAMGGSG
jgi:hypothetical protein